jgi:hypothetical protein
MTTYTAKQIKEHAMSQPGNQFGQTYTKTETKIGVVECSLLREANGADGKTHVAAWFYLNRAPISAKKLDEKLKAAA